MINSCQGVGLYLFMGADDPARPSASTAVQGADVNACDSAESRQCYFFGSELLNRTRLGTARH